MNSSLQKALAASLLAVGGAVSAIGQGYDYDANCVDPNNTAPYSVPFISYYMETPMWSAGIGVTGTVAWKFCVPPNGGSVPVAGRFEFGPGPVGTIQDDLRVAAGKDDVCPDNYEDFAYGSNHIGADPAWLKDKSHGGVGLEATSGSGWSFARIYYTSGTTTNSFLYGGAAFDVAFQGASNRYMYTRETANNIQAQLVIDVLGDSSRFSWRLTNVEAAGGKPLQIGLYLGQWITPTGGYLYSYFNGGANDPGQPVDDYGLPQGWTTNQTQTNGKQDFQPYVLVPGQKPLTIDQRFNRASNPSAFPSYLDFSGTTPSFISGVNVPPNTGGGLQIVMAPTPNVEDSNGNSDQTPVDEFDVGDVAFLMDGVGIQSNPTFNLVTFSDADFSTGACYVQRWEPNVSVPVGGYRDIVSYYRSTWGDSSYSDGYTAVVDTPKAISSSQANPGSFDPNPFTIRVWVDNTGGFGDVYKTVGMSSVQVTLKLPQGMHAVGNPAQTTLTQYISPTTGQFAVPPVGIGFTDFQVQVDPTVFGPQPYTATITPTPGAVKTITGTINVAATPNLQVDKGANLVTSPWTYNDATWQAVLAPLTPVTDYQAYTWDATQQAYVIQTGPQRGAGTWIVSNSAQGVVPLQGGPTQPTDEFPPSLGAPNITLQQGWNLIGNPYNYSFPLGQLVGVPAGTSTALTFAQLVSQNVFDGSFAYYDPGNQTYDFLQNPTDELLPNYGYWVYANGPLTLNFPPLYDLFNRAPKAKQNTNQLFNHYRLQLAAKGNKSQDSYTFVGMDATSAPTWKSAKKAPISPATGAIRGFATSSTIVPNTTTQGQGTVSNEYAQMMHSSYGKQIFNYSVYSNSQGPVSVSWPNIGTLPKNLAVTLEDLQTKKTYNARTTAGLAYEASYSGNTMMKTFQVTISPEGTVRQTISNVTEKVQSLGGTKHMLVGFDCTTSGEATLTLWKNGKQVGTLIQNMGIQAGFNSTIWPMYLSNGQVVTPGSYVLQISAVGEGGDTATKLVELNF